MPPYQAKFNIVLVEPEIPNNTGNIGRTCVATQSKLHLVGPLGFSLSDKYLRRSGLDYWPKLNWQQYANWQAYYQQLEPEQRLFYFTTKTKQSLYDIKLRPGDNLVFGKETKGLSEELLAENRESCLTLPMPGEVRSLNLANAVAVSLYEGLRQLAL